MVPTNSPLTRCGRGQWQRTSAIVPYRGVALAGICFAELAVDAMARELGREPYDLRMQNLVPGDAVPYTTITGGEFDSGDYPEALRRAGDLIDLPAVRGRQKQGRRTAA